jgi:hypothetical protein
MSRSALLSTRARMFAGQRTSEKPPRATKVHITQQILERNMGRAPVVLTGFLEFLFQNKSMLLTGGDQNRVRIRKLAIALNLYGGVCLLDTLSQMDILKILGVELQRVLANEKKNVKVKT